MTAKKRKFSFDQWLARYAHLIAKLAGLRPNTGYVWLALNSFRGANGIYVGYRRISEITGLGERTVKRASTESQLTLFNGIPLVGFEETQPEGADASPRSVFKNLNGLSEIYGLMEDVPANRQPKWLKEHVYCFTKVVKPPSKANPYQPKTGDHGNTDPAKDLGGPSGHLSPKDLGGPSGHPSDPQGCPSDPIKGAQVGTRDLYGDVDDPLSNICVANTPSSDPRDPPTTEYQRSEKPGYTHISGGNNKPGKRRV